MKERRYENLPCRGVGSDGAPPLPQPTLITLRLYTRTNGSVRRKATCKYLNPEGTCNAGKTDQDPVCPRVRPEREFQKVSDTPTPAVLVTLTEAATGKTDKEIAKALGRSLGTVQTQLQSVDPRTREDQGSRTTRTERVIDLVQRGLIDPLTAADGFDSSTISDLTPIERERLQSLVKHPELTDEALAEELRISPATLRTQIRAIKDKIGSNTRTELTVRGYIAFSLKAYRSLTQPK